MADALAANRKGGARAIAARAAGVPSALPASQTLAPRVNADGQVHEHAQCGGHVEWIIGTEGTVTLNSHRLATLPALHALARTSGCEQLLLRDALASPRVTVVASVTVMADDREPAVFELGDPTTPPLRGRLPALPEHLDALQACVDALATVFPGSAQDAATWLTEQRDTAQQNERAEHADLIQTVIEAAPEATLLRDAAERFTEMAERAEREEAVNAAVEAVFAAASPRDMVALAEGMLHRARLQAARLQAAVPPRGE